MNQRPVISIVAFVALAAVISCATNTMNSGGTRFSPLNQIHRDNVAKLRRAWTYHTGELNVGKAPPAFEATPLEVDGVLYFTTPSSRVIALDAETGKELWVFDPQAGRERRNYLQNRGVSYWEAGKERRTGSLSQVQRRRRVRPFLGPAGASLPEAALGLAQRCGSEYRRDRLESAARRGDRSVEFGRLDGHCRRIGIHRRDQRQPLPGLRCARRQAIMGDAPRSQRLRHAHDVRGNEN